MDTKDLKCFAAVYEERSINKAAHRMYITPQGLSKNIKLLENELDVVLFERTRQGVNPTQCAELLYSKAASLLHQMEEMEFALRQQKNQEVILRIGCACGIFNVIPLSLIQNFTRDNSQIRVEWCEYSNQEVLERVQDSRLEYGFMVGACEDDQMVQEKLVSREVKLLVYEGHPLYERKRISVEELKGLEIVTLNEHFHMYHDFQSLCREKGFAPDIAAKTADSMFLCKLCRQKAGLALVPDFALEGLEMGSMRAVSFEESFDWDVWGVYKEGNRNYDTIRRFDRYLKENASKKG